MRIKENIIMKGYYWLPSTPGKKVPGTLRINDGGIIELETFGLFDDSLEGCKKIINEAEPLERIVGHTEKHAVTLENCFFKKSNISFGGLSTLQIHVGRAFIGYTYNEKEDILFNNFTFSVEGIDEWVDLTGIKVENNYNNNTSSINYSPPSEITYNLKNGMQLVITFSWTIPGLPNTNEAKITQKTYFKLLSDIARPIKDFISTAYKITNFICFAVDKTVCIDKVLVSSNIITEGNHDTKIRPLSILVYYESLPYVKIEPKIEKHKFLFNYPQIQKDAERKINNWINAYDIIEPAISSYFSTKTEGHKYLDSNFLALVQGLETYHRRTSNEKRMDENEFNALINCLIQKCPEGKQEWLLGRLQHGNELSLKQRIKNVIEPFKKHLGTSKERDRLLRSIVDTRNYLTHYDETLKSKAVTGKDLLAICLRMEAIFQLLFLQVLGFSKEEIKTILKNSYTIKHKITFNNESV